MNLYANYDAVRWQNFYGLGNETNKNINDLDYYRMRYKQFLGSFGIERAIKNRYRISINPFFQSYEIINDSARFVAKQQQLPLASIYQNKNFAGANVQFIYQKVDNNVLPIKGLSVLAVTNYTSGVKNTNASFGKFSTEANLYQPLNKKFGLKLKAGMATLVGDPEFYQFNYIGGGSTLRGYQRERFYGNQSFYNQNELRWITDIKSYLYNGKLGFFGLVDAGRIWLDGEQSNKWHSSYGGGLIISPFNKISISVAYAISPEDKRIHFAAIKVL